MPVLDHFFGVHFCYSGWALLVWGHHYDMLFVSTLHVSLRHCTAPSIPSFYIEPNIVFLPGNFRDLHDREIVNYKSAQICHTSLLSLHPHCPPDKDCCKSSTCRKHYIWNGIILCVRISILLFFKPLEVTTRGSATK